MSDNIEIPEQLKNVFSPVILSGLVELFRNVNKHDQDNDILSNYKNPMTVQEVAEVARREVKTIYGWKRSGELLPCNDSGKLLFDKEEVRRLLTRKNIIKLM